MSREDLGFSDAQWEVLKHGPLYMLAHVAGTDAYIDSAEWMALVDLVLESASSDDHLTSTIMGELSAELHNGRTQIPDHRTPLAGLEEVAHVLLEWNGADSTAFRSALMEIGATVADASGAQLTIRYATHHGDGSWLPSSATSPAEHRALSAAATALGLAVPAEDPSESPAVS
ncbi:MAG: hypothetical protein AB7I38_07600 [Dehalococcoidia bacterium]